MSEPCSDKDSEDFCTQSEVTICSPSSEDVTISSPSSCVQKSVETCCDEALEAVCTQFSVCELQMSEPCSDKDSEDFCTHSEISKLLALANFSSFSFALRLGIRLPVSHDATTSRVVLSFRAN